METVWLIHPLLFLTMSKPIPSATLGEPKVARPAPKEPILMEMEFATLLMLSAGHGIEPTDFASPATKATILLMALAFCLAQTQLLLLTLGAIFGKKVSALNARLDGYSMRSESASQFKTSVEPLTALLNA